MKLKKLFKTFLATSVAAVVPLTAASCLQTNTYQATLISDTPNWKTGNFVENAYDGMIAAKKALAKQNINFRVTLPQTVENGSLVTLNNAIRTAINNGSKIIIAAGSNYNKSISEMSALYPNVFFVLIDAATYSPHRNVYNLQFPEQEAGYLTGVLDGLSAYLQPQRFGKKEGAEFRFASCGGAPIPPVQRYIWGYRIGLEYINNKQHFEQICKSAKISLPKGYANTKLIYKGSTYFNYNFSNVNNIGSTYTLNTLTGNDPADVIFAVAGGTNNAIIDAAKEVNYNRAPTKYIVGADSNVYSQGVYNYNGKNESVVLNSAVKGINPITSALLQYVYLNGPLSGKKPTNTFKLCGTSPQDIITNIAKIQVPGQVGTTPNVPGIKGTPVSTAFNTFYHDHVSTKVVTKDGKIDLTDIFAWPNNNIFAKGTKFYSQDLNLKCEERNGSFTCKA